MAYSVKLHTEHRALSILSMHIPRMTRGVVTQPQAKAIPLFPMIKCVFCAYIPHSKIHDIQQAENCKSSLQQRFRVHLLIGYDMSSCPQSAQPQVVPRSKYILSLTASNLFNSLCKRTGLQNTRLTSWQRATHRSRQATSSIAYATGQGC